TATTRSRSARTTSRPTSGARGAGAALLNFKRRTKMSADKNYSKIETDFLSFQLDSAPSTGDQPGSPHNPAVQPALNTAPDQGVVKYCNFYYTPQSPAPSIQNSNPLQRIDTHFEDVHKQTIAYAWRPPDDTRAHGTGQMESPINNPFQMDVGNVPTQYQPTPPGNNLQYGGGQNDGDAGATGPGPTMSYGGGQGPGGTAPGNPSGYGGGQGPVV